MLTDEGTQTSRRSEKSSNGGENSLPPPQEVSLGKEKRGVVDCQNRGDQQNRFSLNGMSSLQESTHKILAAMLSRGVGRNRSRSWVLVGNTNLQSNQRLGC